MLVAAARRSARARARSAARTFAGTPLGPARRAALFGQLAQIARRRLARAARAPADTRSAARRARSCSVRAIAASPRAARADRAAPAARERRWRSALGCSALAALRDRLAEAHGGERVLQRLARAHVHVHVAGRDQRQAAVLRDCRSAARRRAIVRAAVQLDRDPGSVPETARAAMSRCSRAVCSEQPQDQREASGAADCEIGARQPVLRPCRCAGAPRVISVDRFRRSRLRRCEQHDVQIVERAELRADDQLQPCALAATCARTMPAIEHSSVIASAAVTERGRALDQLARMRGAAQEREVAEAMQLRVSAHDQNPCRYQPPRSPRSR